MTTRQVIVLHFSGCPDDPHGVAEVFQAHGCPRDLAYRITEELRASHSRTATVLDTVNVAKLTAELVPFKVAVENLGQQTQTWE